MTEKDAVLSKATLGLTVAKYVAAGDPSKKGRVISQSTPGGTRTSENIYLVVGR